MKSMSTEMYSEVFTLFRMGESGIYICLICEQNIFADLELEPHALEEHLLNVHDLTLQPQDEIEDDLEQDNTIHDKIQDDFQDIDAINREEDIDDPDYIETSSRKRKYSKNSSSDSQIFESNNVLMEAFDHIQGVKFQCKECGKILRQIKSSNNNLQRHLLQQHVKLYRKMFGRGEKFENETGSLVSSVDNATALAWMEHISRRRQSYGEHVKKLQKQLDEKYDLYKQIGKDIDYLNEELDQYRITWLKEQRRIETVTNYVTQNKKENSLLIDQQITISEDDDLRELLASQSTNDDEDLDDIISSEANQNDAAVQPPNKKTRIVDGTKPIFKVRFAERKY